MKKETSTLTELVETLEVRPENLAQENVAQNNPNEHFLTGTASEDVNANGRATVQLKLSLADSSLLIDQAEKNLVALRSRQTETLDDLYKKGAELQKIIEEAAVKLGLDVKNGRWQFDPIKLRLFR